VGRFGKIYTRWRGRIPPVAGIDPIGRLGSRQTRGRSLQTARELVPSEYLPEVLRGTAGSVVGDLTTRRGIDRDRLAVVEG